MLQLAAPQEHNFKIIITIDKNNSKNTGSILFYSELSSNYDHVNIYTVDHIYNY